MKNDENDEKLKEQYFNTYRFSNHNNKLIFEKVFTLMNIWMIVKNSMKHRYKKKTIFIFI